MIKDIFIDTNIIIEAVRHKILKNLLNSYNIHTVEEVIKECNPVHHRQNKGFVEIDMSQLESKVKIIPVADMQRVKLAITPNMPDLHRGERDLLSALIGWNNPFRLCLADFAAINAAVILDFNDNLVSLEELANDINIKKEFRSQFTRKVLSAKKTEFILSKFE